ncbi:MAG: histidine kinase, partial [Tannerellaceae bacterium]
VVCLTMVNNFYRQMIALHQRAAQLEDNSIQAQYAALQSQLNPHFLFNSLNTLISEIEYNPHNAALFTRHLSDVYRYILQCQEQRLVTLRSELEFLNSYIFLHKVRLGDCIRVKNLLPESLLEAKLPPLTLQLLAENVIKHNTIRSGKPMTIVLSYDDDDDELLVMSNEISPKKGVAPSGTGLKNLAARYQLICDRTIHIEEDTQSFTVKIPLLNE